MAVGLGNRQLWKLKNRFTSLPGLTCIVDVMLLPYYVIWDRLTSINYINQIYNWCKMNKRLTNAGQGDEECDELKYNLKCS